MLQYAICRYSGMFLVFVFLASLSACRLEITAPRGGDVISSSGEHDCTSGETCLVEVEDFLFDDQFAAPPRDGWVFLGWKREPGQVCAFQGPICHLSTVGFEDYEVLADIVESEETFYLEPEFVRGTPVEQALVSVRDARLRACLREQLGDLEYAEQLTLLECDTLLSLAGLEAFVGLRYLILEDFENEDVDWQPLAGLIRLRRLEVIGNGDDETFSDLAPLADALADLTLLQILDLSRNGIADLTPLAAPLADMIWLHTLVLHSNEIVDIGALADLKGLTTLDLTANFITDIGPLSELIQMRKLMLNGNSINELGPLAGLSRVSSLQLSGNNVSDISPLAGMTGLEDLEMVGGSVSDISSLAGLTGLKSVNLRFNAIGNIGPLAGLLQLRKLDLAFNGIRDVSPLSDLTRLRELGLDYNHVSDLLPLRNLRLNILSLKDNRIADLSPLADVASIERLELDRNLIGDISALSDHYPLPGDPTLGVFLGLAGNRITRVGDALDGITSAGKVILSDNPLGCAEIDRLVNEVRYDVVYYPLPDECM